MRWFQTGVPRGGESAAPRQGHGRPGSGAVPRLLGRWQGHCAMPACWHRAASPKHPRSRVAKAGKREEREGAGAGGRQAARGAAAGSLARSYPSRVPGVQTGRALHGAQPCARQGQGRPGEPGAGSGSSPAEGVYLGVVLREAQAPRGCCTHTSLPLHGRVYHTPPGGFGLSSRRVSIPALNYVSPSIPADGQCCRRPLPSAGSTWLAAFGRDLASEITLIFCLREPRGELTSDSER